jgi:predicted amidohydrolase
MRVPLTIAVAQPLCRPGDVASNIETHVEAIRAAKTRVIVFPELSLTGYELDASAIAVDDARLMPLVDACAEDGATALVGAPVSDDDGSSHIAMLAIDETGVRIVYRKMYLGDVETARFGPGLEPGLLEIDGWRLGLAICKDTGIQRHATETAALGIDAYVAGSVKTPAEAMIQDERARRIAIKHRIPVAIASGAGSQGIGYDPAAGGSAIWSSDGTVAVHAGSEPGEIARSTIC